MLRLSRRPRLLCLAVTLALLATIGAPALATAPTTPDFGPSIDAYARYEGQSGCSGTEPVGVRDFRAMLQDTYGANGGGILRSCSSGGKSEHKEGRAYDWMLDANDAGERKTADEFLTWLLATDAHGNRHAMARRLGVMYVIWNRRTWSAYRPEAGWQPYTGSHPHTDHIHLSFSWDGANGATSFWNTVELATEPGPFVDVPATHRFVDEIARLADTELISGRADGTFLPEQDLSRGQAATVLWRLMGEPDASTTDRYDDVPADAHYARAVNWLTTEGVAGGVGDGRFDPHEPVSRGQLAVMLHELADRPDAPVHRFVDITEGHHFGDAVSWLVDSGITRGTTSSTFSGHDPLSRGQMAALTTRAIDEVDEWPAAR